MQMKQIMEAWRKQALLGEALSGQDIEGPGNKFYMSTDSDYPETTGDTEKPIKKTSAFLSFYRFDTYVVLGNTHGKFSHALKHLYEFGPEKYDNDLKAIRGDIITYVRVANSMDNPKTYPPLYLCDRPAKAPPGWVPTGKKLTAADFEPRRGEHGEDLPPTVDLAIISNTLDYLQDKRHLFTEQFTTSDQENADNTFGRRKAALKDILNAPPAGSANYDEDKRQAARDALVAAFKKYIRPSSNPGNPYATGPKNDRPKFGTVDYGEIRFDSVSTDGGVRNEKIREAWLQAMEKPAGDHEVLLEDIKENLSDSQANSFTRKGFFTDNDDYPELQRSDRYKILDLVLKLEDEFLKAAMDTMLKRYDAEVEKMVSTAVDCETNYTHELCAQIRDAWNANAPAANHRALKYEAMHSGKLKTYYFRSDGALMSVVPNGLYATLFRPLPPAQKVKPVLSDEEKGALKLKQFCKEIDENNRGAGAYQGVFTHEGGRFIGIENIRKALCTDEACEDQEEEEKEAEAGSEAEAAATAADAATAAETAETIRSAVFVAQKAIDLLSVVALYGGALAVSTFAKGAIASGFLRLLSSLGLRSTAIPAAELMGYVNVARYAPFVATAEAAVAVEGTAAAALTVSRASTMSTGIGRAMLRLRHPIAVGAAMLILVVAGAASARSRATARRGREEEEREAGRPRREEEEAGNCHQTKYGMQQCPSGGPVDAAKAIRQQIVQDYQRLAIAHFTIVRQLLIYFRAAKVGDPTRHRHGAPALRKFDGYSGSSLEFFQTEYGGKMMKPDLLDYGAPASNMRLWVSRALAHLKKIGPHLAKAHKELGTYTNRDLRNIIDLGKNNRALDIVPSSGFPSIEHILTFFEAENSKKLSKSKRLVLSKKIAEHSIILATQLPAKIGRGWSNRFELHQAIKNDGAEVEYSVIIDWIWDWSRVIKIDRVPEQLHKEIRKQGFLLAVKEFFNSKGFITRNDNLIPLVKRSLEFFIRNPSALKLNSPKKAVRESLLRPNKRKNIKLKIKH